MNPVSSTSRYLQELSPLDHSKHDQSNAQMTLDSLVSENVKSYDKLYNVKSGYLKSMSLKKGENMSINQKSTSLLSNL